MSMNIGFSNVKAIVGLWQNSVRGINEVKAGFKCAKRE